MTTLWSFLLVLSGLILVHEFGHFVVARLFGVRVLKFSLGFGPRIVGVVKGATDYCISAFPLGGFVKMLGEQPEETIPQEDIPYSFSHKPVWQRTLIVAAGPLFNLLFAWAIFFVIFMGYGNPVLLPEIGEVQTGSPAEAAGIRPGDRIVSIDGHSVDTWEDVSKEIRKGGGRAIVLEIERQGHTVTLSVTPMVTSVKNIFGEEVKMPMIGVTAAGKLEIKHLNPIDSVAMAFSRTWNLIVLTAKGFVKIVQRVVPLSSLGGPIMIAQLAGQQAELGVLNLFYFMALLSINLGLLNLLPIPVLDGGHLVFYFVEMVLGRPLTVRQMQLAQQVGTVILGSLMLLVFYNDLARVLGFLPQIGAP